MRRVSVSGLKILAPEGPAPFRRRSKSRPPMLSLFCNHIKFLSTRLCEIGSRARRRLKRPFPTRPRWMSSLNIDNAAKVTPAAYGKRGIGSISCTKSCSTRSLRRISPARWMERVRPFGISRFASWADCSTSGSNEDSAWTIPFVGLTFSQRDPFEIQLYTVGEIAAIMAAAEKNAPGLVPFLAVSFFCGIRRAEAMRLEWPAIDLHENFIKLPAAITKSRQGRHINLSDNCRAWLAPYATEKRRMFPFSDNVLRDRLGDP
jgi:hypothetical protein